MVTLAVTVFKLPYCFAVSAIIPVLIGVLAGYALSFAALGVVDTTPVPEHTGFALATTFYTPRVLNGSRSDDSARGVGRRGMSVIWW